MLVTFSPAHSQSSSKNGMEGSETTFAHTCVLQPDCPAPGDTCHEHMPEHPNLTPSLLARQHRTFGLILNETFGLILFPQALPNTPTHRFHFLPPVSFTSQPSPAVLVQTDSTALGKAGSEPVCAVERQRAGQEDRELARTSSKERGRVLAWLLACTACTWVVIVLASAFPRLEGIEEAKVMLMFLKRPCWGLIRCESHLREVNHKPAGLLLPA